MYIFDASFIVSSFLASEQAHPICKKFFDQIMTERFLIFEPEIVLPEIASGLIRSTGDLQATLSFCKEVRNLSNFYFIQVDSYLAELATDCAVKLKIKGADSIYVALAFNKNLTLVTADKEQRDRAEDFIKIIYLGK